MDSPPFFGDGFKPRLQRICAADCLLSARWLIEHDFIEFGCIHALSEKEVDSWGNTPKEAPSEGTQQDS